MKKKPYTCEAYRREGVKKQSAEFSKQCPSCLEGKLTYLDYKNVFVCNLCAAEILMKVD